MKIQESIFPTDFPCPLSKERPQAKTMKYTQIILCLAIALTSMSINAIVYGQLAESGKNSCLIVGLHDLGKSPAEQYQKTMKNPVLKKMQLFFDEKNIPIEISYVLTGAQYVASDNFMTSEIKPIAEQLEPTVDELLQKTPLQESPKNQDLSIPQSDSPKLRDPLAVNMESQIEAVASL